jgi:hypothetical protein
MQNSEAHLCVHACSNRLYDVCRRRPGSFCMSVCCALCCNIIINQHFELLTGCVTLPRKFSILENRVAHTYSSVQRLETVAFFWLAHAQASSKHWHHTQARMVQ